MNNVLTIDCEDWYHTLVSQKYIGKADTPLINERIEATVLHLLDILEKHNCLATFFILGEVAQKYPRLVRKIDQAGHRIGAHSYTHTSVSSINKDNFEREVAKVTEILNKISSKPVESFRAPNWSINSDNLWAIKILKKYGYRYDSSFKSMHIPRYPEANVGLIEIPRSSASLYGYRMPLGGAYLRVYPIKLIMSHMKRINANQQPFMVYIHPWEIDMDIPRIKTSIIDYFIQYFGISGNLKKIDNVLKEFSFIPLEKFFDENILDKSLINKFYCLI